MILLRVFMDIGFGDRRFDRRTWCLHVDRGRNVRVFCPEADLWEKQKIAAIIGANGEYTAAVSYTRGLDEIDPDRIVFWNTVEALTRMALSMKPAIGFSFACTNTSR